MNSRGSAPRRRLSAEPFDSAEDRRHDAGSESPSPPNGREQLAGNIRLLDAVLEILTDPGVGFVEFLCARQDDDR